MAMFSNPNDDQDHTRKDILGNETQGFENDTAWGDRTAFRKEHRLNRHEMAFMDYLAYLQRTWSIWHCDNTYQITHGTRWLTDKLSPVTVERLEAWGLIKRPTIDEGNGTVERTQLMRRAMWDLGDRAHEYIADGYLWGENIGDRNERIAHSMGCASIHRIYNNFNEHDEIQAAAYKKLDENGPVYDIIINDTHHDEVYAVVEVETRVGDARALARDAQKLAAAPGESWWLFPTRKAANRALSNMQRKGIVGEYRGKTRWPDTLALETTRQRLNEELSKKSYYSEGQTPPVTRVATYDDMRRMLEEHAPWTIHEYIGSEEGNE